MPTNSPTNSALYDTNILWYTGVMISLTLRLEDTLHEELRVEAFERRVSITQIIRERLEDVEKTKLSWSETDFKADSPVFFNPSRQECKNGHAIPGGRAKCLGKGCKYA